MDLTTAFGRQPGVIVSNPPFDVEGQPASVFFLRALQILSQGDSGYPGYLGMVMPGAFLTGKRSQKECKEAC